MCGWPPRPPPSSRFCPQRVRLVEICTAFNLLVANEFLLYADRDVFDEKVGEEKFSKGVELYASVPSGVVGTFVADDQVDVASLPEDAFELDDPLIPIPEKRHRPSPSIADSSAQDDPLYWQKVYVRLELEYTSASPTGK